MSSRDLHGSKNRNSRKTVFFSSYFYVFINKKHEKEKMLSFISSLVDDLWIFWSFGRVRITSRLVSSLHGEVYWRLRRAEIFICLSFFKGRPWAINDRLEA